MCTARMLHSALVHREGPEGDICAVYHGLDWLALTLTNYHEGKNKMKAIFFLCLVLSGCTLRFSDVQLSKSKSTTNYSVPIGAPTQRCIDLDDDRIVWSAVAKSAGFLSGGSGVSMIPVNDAGGRIALAGVAVGLAAVTLISVVIAEKKGESWIRECSSAQ